MAKFWHPSTIGGGSGGVSSVSVVTANGLAGTVANPTTTPAITLTTTVTGLIKGNGTAFSAAVVGTDYLATVVHDTSLTGLGTTLSPLSALATGDLLSVSVATTGALAGTVTYNNGTAGVGATLTHTTNGAFPVTDGVTINLNDRILVQNQVAQLQNGIYMLTTVGTVSTPYVLTRTNDSDQTSEFEDQTVRPTFGTLNAGVIYQQTTSSVTVGSSNIVYISTSGTNVTQQASGTQTLFNIPTWTTTTRQLSRGIPAFSYNTTTNVFNLGANGGPIGNMKISGNTSGAISILPQAAAGTFNFNLPTTAGTSGQVLTSGGGVASPMTWTTPTTGNITGTGANHQVVFWTGPNTVTGDDTFNYKVSNNELILSDAIGNTIFNFEPISIDLYGSGVHMFNIDGAIDSLSTGDIDNAFLGTLSYIDGNNFTITDNWGGTGTRVPVFDINSSGSTIKMGNPTVTGHSYFTLDAAGGSMDFSALSNLSADASFLNINPGTITVGNVDQAQLAINQTTQILTFDGTDAFSVFGNTVMKVEAFNGSRQENRFRAGDVAGTGTGTLWDVYDRDGQITGTLNSFFIIQDVTFNPMISGDTLSKIISIGAVGTGTELTINPSAGMVFNDSGGFTSQFLRLTSNVYGFNLGTVSFTGENTSIIFSGGTGAITALLPTTGENFQDGTLLMVMDGDGIAAANTITIDAGSGNTINDNGVIAQTTIIDSNGGSKIFYKISSTGWLVVGSNSSSPSIITSFDATGLTASNANLKTITVPNDGTFHQYQFAPYLTITALSAATVTTTVTYTDETNTSRTQTIFPTGATAAAGTTGAFSLPVTTIRAKSNTTIVAKSVLTGVSATYDIGGSFIKIN